MKFKLMNPRSDFGVKGNPQLNPQKGDSGKVIKETDKGYFVRFENYPQRDYFLYKDEIEIV